MRRLSLLFMIGCLGAFALPASASATEFGFADVNTGLPGDPNAPAFPGEKALWAGTCNLSDASTENGGVGTAPTVRGHCIDLGGSTLGNGPGSDSPWPLGQEPSWRLDPIVQAGAHPDATAAFLFNYDPVIGNNAYGSVKNIIVKLPPGVVGNPEALPKCPALAIQAVPPACTAESQAGITTLTFGFCGISGPGECHHWQTRPVYNAEPRDTITAEFTIAGISNFFNVPITARGRTNGDYGVDTLALLIPDFVPLAGQAFTFWGVPWAREHDQLRVDGDSGYSGSGNEGHVEGFPEEKRRSYEESWGPIKPFFTNPTECSGEPLPVTVEMDSWQNPVTLGGSYIAGTTLTDVLTDCEEIDFDPSITLRPDVSIADSPSGLNVVLSTPQNNDPPADIAFDPEDDTGAPAYWSTPAGRATAHLKDTVIHLPRGTSFNPAAADGLQGCSTAQIGLTATAPKITFNNDPVQCPESSKIGTLEIVSPLLQDPLLGAVYAAPQHDNPFPGTLTTIYLVSQDEERGLSIKLAGKVDLDPDTGQISTTFVDNPQLPFDKFNLQLETGSRAPLNTPPVCGQFENIADLIPWSFPESGPQPSIHDPFPITQMPNGFKCVTEPEDRSFAPGFVAGTTPTLAGGNTDFILGVSRRDGEQEISGVSLDMPPGVTGDLSKTPYCPEPFIAAARTKSGLDETNGASCPPASRIGKVDTAAGPGPTPLHTAGTLYLSGPYDPDGAGPKPKAPLSVTTIVPAIAGGVPGNPSFDLGNVVIRTGVKLDPQTAQVHIDSTDVPYIVGGVPLRVRNIAVDLDKPSFMRNPTNCDPLSVGGSIRGAADPLDRADDIFAAVSNRFQVRGCEKLGFKPKLKLRLKGGTRRADYPAFTATLTPRPGDANLKSISVALPHSIFLAQNHINTICTRPQFAANTCPEGSIYGFAKAWTPLLKDPLEGPVYLKSSDNPLPDLVLGLRGQVDLNVEGRIDSVDGGIRTSFDVTPDAPVTKFVLSMKGGKKGLMENSRNLCTRSRTVKKIVNGEVRKVRNRLQGAKAKAKYVAQNGILLNQKIPVVAEGCSKKKGSKAKGKR